MSGQASARDRTAPFALLSAFAAAALLAAEISLINRTSAPSNAEMMLTLTLQGLSALSTLTALALGVRALVAGPTARVRLVGSLAMAIALVSLLAWLPVFFGISL